MRALISFLFFFCLPIPLAFAGSALPKNPLQDFKLPSPELETLPNGLQVAWFLSDALPVVDLALVVKSGERDDPRGKSGTADLMAVLLDRGAAGMSAQDISQAVEMLGASRYSSTEDDTSSVGMHGLAPDAPALLDLLSKIALSPDFPEKEVERERTRMLDRWEHMPDYGANLVTLALHDLLAKGTIYGRGGFVSAHEFKKVGRADVVKFHRDHFTPHNSILMVVGRVNRTGFRARILNDFGNWKGPAPQRHWVRYANPRIQGRPGTGREVVVINRPLLTQAEVRFGMPGPLFSDPRRYSLSVANALLGEYFNSRLNSLIRDQLGLTYSIQSSFNYAQVFGTFSITSATRNESVGQVIGKTIEVLKNLKDGDIPEEEVSTAKDYLVGGFPLSTSTLGAVASRWVGGWIFGLGPDYLNEFVPKVEAVTAADVRQAVRETFHLNEMVIAVVGDASVIEKSLKDEGIAYREVPLSALMGPR